MPDHPPDEKVFRAAGWSTGLVAVTAAPSGYLLGIALWTATGVADLPTSSSSAQSVMAATFACWFLGLLVGGGSSFLAIGAGAASSTARGAMGLGGAGAFVTAGSMVVMVVTVIAWLVWSFSHHPSWML